MLLQKIIQALQNIPKEKRVEVYDLIPYFRFFQSILEELKPIGYDLSLKKR